MENRREHRRHGVLINVRVQDETRLKKLHATDLSKGGMFLATRSEMEVGQSLAVALVHPLTEATFEIECAIANARKGEDGAVVGYGLRFVTFDERVREELSLFVEGVVELEAEEDLEIIEDDAKPPPLPPDAKERARGLVAQGKQLAREGNLVGAAHVLSRATALAPADEEAWEALGKVEGRLSKSPRRSAPPEEDLAVDIEVGEFDEPDVEWGTPEVVLDEPAAFEPADRRKAKLLFEAALDCHATGDIDDAIGYLERSLGSDPAFVPSYWALAKIVASAKGDTERGVFLCTRALELEPKNEMVLAVLDTIRSRAS